MWNPQNCHHIQNDESCDARLYIEFHFWKSCHLNGILFSCNIKKIHRRWFLGYGAGLDGRCSGRASLWWIFHFLKLIIFISFILFLSLSFQVWITIFFILCCHHLHYCCDVVADYSSIWRSVLRLYLGSARQSTKYKVQRCLPWVQASGVVSLYVPCLPSSNNTFGQSSPSYPSVWDSV